MKPKIIAILLTLTCLICVGCEQAPESETKRVPPVIALVDEGKDPEVVASADQPSLWMTKDDIIRLENKFPDLEDGYSIYYADKILYGTKALKTYIFAIDDKCTAISFTISNPTLSDNELFALFCSIETELEADYGAPNSSETFYQGKPIERTSLPDDLNGAIGKSELICSTGFIGEGLTLSLSVVGHDYESSILLIYNVDDYAQRFIDAQE